MNTQPKALRLADALEQQFPVGTAKHFLDGEAAAELRRLHEAHDWQYRMAGYRLRRVEKLEAERDALLEALHVYQHAVESGMVEQELRAAYGLASAVTTKVEGTR